MPLLLAGIVQDEAYFAREIEPHLNERIRYLGSVGPSERDKLLGGAYALLHLIHFDEPFGLSMVEAMACGTPVVATRRGSVPEVVRDGLSGFVVERVEEALDALPKVAGLERAAVRRDAEERFEVRHMVAGYLKVYRDILSRPLAETLS